jgi:hypothetical protein
MLPFPDFRVGRGWRRGGGGGGRGWRRGGGGGGGGEGRGGGDYKRITSDSKTIIILSSLIYVLYIFRSILNFKRDSVT